jgi:predicted transcriptional regulator
MAITLNEEALQTINIFEVAVVVVKSDRGQIHETISTHPGLT